MYIYTSTGGHQRGYKTTNYIFRKSCLRNSIIMYKLEIVQYILHVQLYICIYLKQELVFSMSYYIG